MNIDALQDLNLAGVRWELTETPRAQAIQTPAAAAETRTNSTQNGPTIVPAVAPIMPDDAAQLATAAQTVDAVIDAIKTFNHPLCTTAARPVLPQIAAGAQMMIITDVPGADDDATGNILTGAPGELMDKMLMAIGLTRDSVSIVPLVFWRTPGGRTPTDEELDLARPFVDRLIELTAPRVILTLGTIAGARVAERKLPGEHGMENRLGDTCVAMPIYHPNFLILKPAAKRDVWTALQSAQNLLKDAEK